MELRQILYQFKLRCDSRVEAKRLDNLAKFFRNSPDMKTSIPPVLIIFALICFALLPRAQAVSPAPRWRLSRRQHSRGTKFPVEPYERHLQYRSRNILASKLSLRIPPAASTQQPVLVAF